MVGLRFRKFVNAAIATSSLTVSGCVSRLLPDPAFGGDDSDDSAGTGGSADTGNPSDPTKPGNPTNPGNPSDPSDDTGPSVPIDGPPQLIDVRVLDAAQIELFFSEPLASAQSVDPKKFRLSAAAARDYYGYYSGTWYQEIGNFDGEQTCYEYCWCPYYEYCYDGEGEYCNEYCYTQPGPPLAVVSVADHPDHADRLILHLERPLSSRVCQGLRDLEQSGDVGMFIHYSNNGSPAVVDTQGDALDAIAEHWVLESQNYSYTPDIFPNLDPFLPIDCPF
jgi:hypothetical protein